jgi:hypothetical protein
MIYEYGDPGELCNIPELLSWNSIFKRTPQCVTVLKGKREELGEKPVPVPLCPPETLN